MSKIGRTGLLAALFAICAVVLAAGIIYSDAKTKDSSTTPLDPTVSAAMDPERGGHYALAFGDSYFNGSSTVPVLSTFGQVALTALGYNPISKGASDTGYTVGSARVPAYLGQLEAGSVSMLANDKIEVVVLEGGISDVDAQSSSARIETQAAAVMEKLGAQFKQAKKFVLGVTADATGRMSPARSAASAAIRRAATATGWYFVDSTGVVTPEKAERIFGPDGSPTLAGHAVMAKALKANLEHTGIRTIPAPR